MKEYFGILKSTRLFSGVEESELAPMLGCLGAAVRHYGKGEYVLRAGERTDKLAILVQGTLYVQKEDYWGNRSIVNAVAVGDMLGETREPVNDVVAITDSTVVMFDIDRVLNVCPSACKFHSLTVRNLFYAVSEKNRGLVTKLTHMSNRTTREKLLSYLSDEAKKQGGSVFTIPFDRQQLSDYLSVDRSAMSAELSKMRADGLIDYKKNKFQLKNAP